MALEDTDTNDMEVGGEPGGNGDEQSNRTFRIAAIVLGIIAVAGLILIAVIFLSRQGERAQIAAVNASINATNTEVARLALITPVPLATDTPVPTNTSAPSPTPKPSTATTAPTTAPTAAPTTGVTVTAAATGPAATSAPSTPKSPATTAQAVSTAKPAGTAAVTPGASTSITSTKPVTGTKPGEPTVPTTGAGDSIGWIALAAGLVAMFVIARRVRTSQA
jgi:cytoskeletal protein RodZ